MNKRPRSGRILAFLSYDSRDQAAVAQFAEKLRYQGVDVWRDQTHLRPGCNWEKEINAALKECDVVLACVSRHSLENSGFLQIELTLALTEARNRPSDPPFVIPVRLERCGLPGFLQPFHAYDLFEPAKFVAFNDVVSSFVPKERSLRTILGLASRQLDSLIGLTQQDARLDDVLLQLNECKMSLIRSLTAEGRNDDARVLAAIAPHPSFRDKRARIASQAVACRNHVLAILEQM